MNRRVLTSITVALAALGLAFIAVPLIGSLKLNAKADAALPRMDLSQLQPGRPEIRDHPLYGKMFGEFSWSVLVLKHAHGKVSVWDIPTRDGKVAMPDIRWWRPFYVCASFVLSARAAGESVRFHCTDAEVPDFWRGEWQWSESGTALGNNVDDMQATAGAIEGKYFVFAKRS